MAARRSRRVSAKWRRFWRRVRKNLNFFRVHCLFFTFTPLIFSAILYAANSPTPNAPAISYIDALFNCISAMTVCGLATVDLSGLTGFQQALLFMLSCMGSPVVVSWVIVLMRRKAFARRFSGLRVNVSAMTSSKINFNDANEVANVIERNDTDGMSVRTGITRSTTFASTRSEGSSTLWTFFSRKSTRSGTDSSATPVGGEEPTTEVRPGPNVLPTVEESEDSDSPTSSQFSSGKSKKRRKAGSSGKRKLTTQMISRTNSIPRLVDPSGQLSDSGMTNFGVPLRRTLSPEGIGMLPTIPQTPNILPGELEPEDVQPGDTRPGPTQIARENGILLSKIDTSVPRGIGPRTVTLQAQPTIIQSPRTGYANTRQSGVPLGHTMTVEFAVDKQTGDTTNSGADLHRGRSYRHRGRRSASEARNPPRRSTVGGGAAEVVWDDRRSTMFSPYTATQARFRRTATVQSNTARSHLTHMTPPTSPITPTTMRSSARDRTYSIHAFPTYTSGRQEHVSSMHTGYGGFPGPHILIGRAIRWLAPRLGNKFDRTITMPRTHTIQSMHQPHHSGVPFTYTKSARYLSFPATVGRNSNFRYLTEDELEELGGVEYRALGALLWIVAAYHICIHVLAFFVIWPYITQPRWRSTFQEPALHRYVSPGWFSAFQVVSAYTNTGMSLVDQSMVPFQRAYPMIFVMTFLILAGNTAFPIFLRLTIWTLTKCVPQDSRTNETLHFLLDHPRRCFIYLFPSHQTWFLLTILLSLTLTDYFCFLVLDLGNSTFDSVPVGVRFAIGILQAVAVRAAGFSTISLASLAPAVQVLFVMMMYISVYPIAMSVRSTNVYEERSLGVYEDEEDEYNDDNEPGDDGGSRVAIWGRYLAWHARKQLAFDMWWLGLALFFLCIIEKSKVQDELNWGFFTIFNIIFELISAYGSVGMSLGVPYGNFSFSGAFTPLSKLIICAVMLRGRHRGLPVAIDRAVMLPFEYKRDNSPYSNGELDSYEDDMQDEDDGLEEPKSADGTRGQNGNVVSFITNGNADPEVQRNDGVKYPETESDTDGTQTSQSPKMGEKTVSTSDENEDLKEKERTKID